MPPFEIVPSIPVAYGRVVGSAARAVSQNPLAAAWHWISEGARRIHVEELSARPQGVRWPTLPALLLGCRPSAVEVQAGGGLRDTAYAQLLMGQGADRLVISHNGRDVSLVHTLADALPPGRLMIAISVDESQGAAMEESLRSLRQAGVSHLLLVGAWSAPALRPGQAQAILRCQSEGFRVWAAGGIRHLDTVQRLQQLGLSGILIGQALYDGTLSFRSLKAL